MQIWLQLLEGTNGHVWAKVELAQLIAERMAENNFIISPAVLLLLLLLIFG